MHIAAMILGILGGLSLLGIALLGSALGGIGGSPMLVLISWVIPILAFVGAGVVMQNAKIGGILLLISGAGVLFIIGLNPIGILFSILLLIAGGLGLGSLQSRASA
ncbi:MAG: hypothetical protein L0H15_09220 [Nitrosospira sp.]|nr:hypothetical protein [Nitrosospira sp.]